jgi:hypothetical protein
MSAEQSVINSQNQYDESRDYIIPQQIGDTRQDYAANISNHGLDARTSFFRSGIRRLLATGLTITAAGVGLAYTSPEAYASPTNTRADASGTIELPGGDWLNSDGVNVYSNGSNVEDDAGNEYVHGVLSGEEWQCVELVNRLYLTNGWITSHWYGNGDQLYNNAPSNLTKQAEGSITNISPGDVVSLGDTTTGTSNDDGGHVAVVNSVSGNTVNLINQNTPDVYSTATLSNGTLSMEGWAGYYVIGVVDAPVSNPGNPETTSSVASLATSDGHVQNFKIAGGQLSENWYNPAGGQEIGDWSQPANLPGSATAEGTPAVALQPGTNTINAFVEGSNNQLYTVSYNFQYGTWGPWVSLGGGPESFESSPAVVATSDGNDQVFGTGGGVVEQDWFNPNSGAYGGWTTSASGVGASAEGTPAAVPRSGQNTIDEFYQGTNNQVYETWYSFQNGNWGNPIDMGGNVSSNPESVATSDGNDQVFDIGSNAVQQNWFDPNASPYYGDWISY